MKLACTTCQLVYEPDLAAFGTGTTGCPRCGGWTWIAQLGTAEWSTGVDTEHVAPLLPAVADAQPGPAALPPRTPAVPASATTKT